METSSDSEACVGLRNGEISLEISAPTSCSNHDLDAMHHQGVKGLDRQVSGTELDIHSVVSCSLSKQGGLQFAFALIGHSRRDRYRR